MIGAECRLIQDLLPLYGEKLVSPETAQAIEEHLSSCATCAEAWHLFQEPAPDPLLSQEEEPAPSLGERLAKRVQKTVIAVILLFIVGGAGLAYATFNLGKNLGMDDPSYRLAEELGL